MAFTSIDFAIFLGIVLALYFALPHRMQNRMLLVSSYFFYGSWDWRFLSLIFVSTVVDYFVGRSLGASSDPIRRRRLVSVSMVTNLGILGIFKYFDFFSESLIDLMAFWGMHADWNLIHIVLPVGISFYTFQTMSYTIDIYRGRLEPTDRFFDFALFVAFFPQLVAGPIERASNLLPRVLNPRTVTLDLVSRGSFLILLGVFKKVVIADGVAPSVNAVFGATDGVGGSDIWLASMLFALQIYGDFSGYSDIARGVSKLMGFELMTNFELPYFARSPQEFWRRWHISLSTWLRDYLYISLGGNRGGPTRTYRNLLATMVLGGLWHGAAWSFVLWGLYQGVLLCVHRALVAVRPAGSGYLLSTLKVFFFFQVTCYGWLLFRADSFSQIVEFTSLLFGDFSLTTTVVPRPAFATILGIPLLIVHDMVQGIHGRAQFHRSHMPIVRGLLYALLLWLTVMGFSNVPSEFIYFQF